MIMYLYNNTYHAHIQVFYNINTYKFIPNNILFNCTVFIQQVHHLNKSLTNIVISV